jgi:hypothetical protein
VTVCLGGRDLIVETEAVGRYLSDIPSKSQLANGYANGNGNGNGVFLGLDNHNYHDEMKVRLRGGEGTSMFDDEWKSRPWQGIGIDVLWFENCDHAQVFDKLARRRRLINAIRVYCECGDE